MNTRRRARGFTLVDLLVACTVTGVVAGMALPAYHRQIVQARRHDATGALTRVQAAQERLRDRAGAYAPDLGMLNLPSRSEGGFYTLALEPQGTDAYRARAVALEADADCPEIWLDVKQGFAQPGPNRRCWNR